MHLGLVVLPGGLFDDTEDATVESAFRYALLRINQDRTLLPDTRIVYDIQHLPAQNSFIAAKKGQHPGFTSSYLENVILEIFGYIFISVGSLIHLAIFGPQTFFDVT